jgi:hypothetical protein
MKSNKNIIGVDAGKQSFRNSKLLSLRKNESLTITKIANITGDP